MAAQHMDAGFAIDGVRSKRLPSHERRGRRGNWCVGMIDWQKIGEAECPTFIARKNGRRLPLVPREEEPKLFPDEDPDLPQTGGMPCNFAVT
jgi:hypothetical protein